MHNQVKLQARHGMGLFKTEKGNSYDIPRCYLPPIPVLAGKK